MRPEDLKELLDARPFTPLRLHLSDGAYYDVKHPELALVARAYMDIGVAKRGSGGIMDKIIRVSLLHVVRAEPIHGTVSKAS